MKTGFQFYFLVQDCILCLGIAKNLYNTQIKFFTLQSLYITQVAKILYWMKNGV